MTRSCRAQGLAVVALVLAAVAQDASAAGPSASRRIIEAAISLWRIEEIATNPADRFAIVLSRGVVASGLREYQLICYGIDNDLDRSEPRQLVAVTWTTPDNDPAIQQVTWIGQGTLGFIGSPDGVPAQVYTYDVEKRTLSRRSDAAQPVVSFGFSFDAATLIYATLVAVDRNARERQRLTGIVADDEHGVQFNSDFPYGADIALYAQHDGTNRAVVTISTGTRADQPSAARRFEEAGSMAISSDGSVALLVDRAGRGILEIDIAEANFRWLARDDPKSAGHVPESEAGGRTRRFAVGQTQSFDRPPALLLMDRATGLSRILAEPNATAATLPRGRVHPLRSFRAGAHIWSAHLVTPVEYSTLKTYPTVVMVMDRNDAVTSREQYVLDDAEYRSAYPVQALANRGMAVLMVYWSGEFDSIVGRPQERQAVQAFADAAFDYVVDIGIADPPRIAMTGFSHAGWMVQYGLRHTRRAYAAAVAIDHWMASYVEYVLYDARRHTETFYGGASPYEESSRGEWLAHAIGFNPQRLRAPLLLEAHDRTGGVRHAAYREIIAGLRRFDIPTEFVYYPQGLHTLVRVAEQLSSAERQVDWLCYWLKDEIDPTPEKVTQYARWRKQRERWP